jgi:hypothetical protein
VKEKKKELLCKGAESDHAIFEILVRMKMEMLRFPR